jgi:hypothetical protein
LPNFQRLRKVVSQVAVKPDYIKLIGGTDEITPPFQRVTGTVRFGLNFEAITMGGYRRRAGDERFDGRPKPSDATYDLVRVNYSGIVTVGNIVTGATSAQTAQVIAVVNTVSEKYIIVTKVSGLFVIGENLLIAATVRAVVVEPNARGSAPTMALNALYKYLASEVYRADILAVPGEGPVRGVVEFNDVVYAFRNAVGGLAGGMYRSTTGGWVAVALGREISFTSGGPFEILEGATITGAISTATAVVARVILTSGTWATSDAAGRLILTGQVGNFGAENLDVGANLNVATVAFNSVQLTLLPNGKYEFFIENFGGAAGTRRVYGADGVNRGFEFDGTVYVPIHTGMVVDAPKHVIGHKFHLCFSFGASFQHSAAGLPYVWSPIVGALEIAVGDNITGMAWAPGNVVGGALVIYCRNRTYILYGTGVGDWQLVPYRRELGAYEYTIQDVAQTIVLDDRGITEFQTAQEYGNFSHNTLSNGVRDTINGLRTIATTSCVCRNKNQYRLFFSDGTSYYVTFNGKKNIGVMRQFSPHSAFTAWSGEALDGSERIYIGGANGFVYQQERGTSCDGEKIDSFFDLSYNFQKSPRADKHYRDASIEVKSENYAAFSVGYSLGYGVAGIPQPITQAVNSNLSVTHWDSGLTWDQFVWDGTSLSPSVIDSRGDGENVAFVISSSSEMIESFDITALLIHYTPRRRMRP